jgi:tRNA-dihydrouridine synthase 1
MSRSRDSAKAEREALKERTRALRSERLLEDSTRLASMGQEDADRIKLTGYEWFRSIGSPRYVVAPMVDQSELGYRMLTRRYGAELVYTQMFNAPVFARDKAYRIQNFTTCVEDRPLIVQFAGHDPETMLAAAKMVEDRCDAVDINLGCPQGIAKKGRYGAFLMEELDLLHEIVSHLAQNLKVPVTCKTRIYKGEDGWERTVRLAETLVNAGASLLTIHGRTREEKGHLVREADWATIKRLKEHFAGRVPIICNGGIFEKSDVEQCLEMTGCDGVMSSEGVLENPGLFAANINVEGAYYSNHLKLAEEYLDMCDKYPVWSFKTIRSHVQKTMYRYCVKHLDLRDRLLENVTVEGYRECLRYVRDLQEEERNRERLEDDQEKAGLVNDAVDIKYNESWYHRHWASGTHANAREEGTGCLPEAMTEKRRLVAEQAEEFLTCPSGDDSEELGVLGALFSSE